MPYLPKFLADLGERSFGTTCTVTETEYIDTVLKRIRFQGNLKHIAFTPGQVTQFRVSTNDFRHYTPSYFNQEQGIFEVLFYLHQKGPGSKWADSLEAGHTVNMLRTGGSMKLVQNHHHFMFGDETSLGLFQCMKEAIYEQGHEYLGILELDEAAAPWPGQIGLSVDVVSKSSISSPACSAIQYLNELHEHLWDTWINASFYLTGRAASVQAFRKALLARGVNRNRISVCAYWADGRNGL